MLCIELRSQHLDGSVTARTMGDLGVALAFAAAAAAARAALVCAPAVGIDRDHQAICEVRGMRCGLESASAATAATARAARVCPCSSKASGSFPPPFQCGPQWRATRH